MRPSGQKLSGAFARGATEAGADVVDIGMVSTDALYFAVGELELDGGVMITASHNPAEYNGMKFTRAHAEAISLDTGLATIRERLVSEELPPRSDITGTITQRNVLDDFAQHCLSFVEPRRKSTFADRRRCGQRHGGRDDPARLQELALRDNAALLRARRQLSEPSGQPDRTGEHGRLAGAVREHACDLGVAFDGDADRMFIVDEKGDLIDGSTVTALGRAQYAQKASRR